MTNIDERAADVQRLEYLAATEPWAKLGLPYREAIVRAFRGHPEEFGKFVVYSEENNLVGEYIDSQTIAFSQTYTIICLAISTILSFAGTKAVIALTKFMANDDFDEKDHLEKIVTTMVLLDTAVFLNPEELRALVSLTLFWTSLARVDQAKLCAARATDLINSFRKEDLMDGFREMVTDQEEILENCKIALSTYCGDD